MVPLQYHMHSKTTVKLIETQLSDLGVINQFIQSVKLLLQPNQIKQI